MIEIIIIKQLYQPPSEFPLFLDSSSLFSIALILPENYTIPKNIKGRFKEIGRKEIIEEWTEIEENELMLQKEKYCIYILARKFNIFYGKLSEDHKILIKYINQIQNYNNNEKEIS